MRLVPSSEAAISGRVVRQVAELQRPHVNLGAGARASRKGDDIYLSIIVPAWNGGERLPDTLRSLACFASQQEFAVERIVVDDCSEQSTEPTKCGTIHKLVRTTLLEPKSTPARCRLVTDLVVTSCQVACSLLRECVGPSVTIGTV